MPRSRLLHRVPLPSVCVLVTSVGQGAETNGSRDGGYLTDSGPSSAPGGSRDNASDHRPTAAVAFVLMAQLQFLATLSLVDSTVLQEFPMYDFLRGLR